MAEEHNLSETLMDGALKRHSDQGDPYEHMTTDGNFRKAILRGLDGIAIIAGTNLKETMKLNRNGLRKRDRAKGYVPWFLGGGGGAWLVIREVMSVL